MKIGLLVQQKALVAMNKLTLAAGLLALATPAFATDYYIVQSPRTTGQRNPLIR